MEFNAVIEQWKGIEWWGNTLYAYVVAFLIFFAVLFILMIFQRIVLRRLQKMAEKTKTDLDDVSLGIFAKIRPPFYLFISIYVAFKTLSISTLLESIFKVLFILIIFYEVIRAVDKIVEYVIRKKFARKTKENQQHSQTITGVLKIITRIGIWFIGLTLILGNIGVNVTSLIASLGIGGIAVALAVQNILGDLFSSVSILIDRPFEVGDYIVVGENAGYVEKIGLKSTRLRTLQGEEVILPNKQLTTVAVQNFRRMKKRRVTLHIEVMYGTERKKLEEIPGIIKGILSKIPDAEFERCVLENLGEKSISFEVVYHMSSRDYAEHIQVREKLYLEVYGRFAEKGIEFATPLKTEKKK